MTLALALAALGYLLGWLAGQASGYTKALEEMDDLEEVEVFFGDEEISEHIEVQRRNASWQ